MDTLNKKSVSPLMVVIAFATVYIVWGSTYFFIQKAIVGFPPFLLGAIRFLVAGILMLGWTLLKGESIFVKKDMLRSTISGVLMLFVGTGAVIWVEQYLPSAMVAIMVAAAPLWFTLLDKPKWSENFTNKLTIAGLVIGFAGVVVLFYDNIMDAFSSSGNSTELGAVGILFIGSISWTIGSLYSKYKPTSGSVPVNIGWQMLAAGIAFIPGCFIRNEFHTVQWQSISLDAWLSVAYLIFFGSIAAFSAYVWLLQVRPATQVSTYAYVNPVVAVLLGVFFAHENITIMQVLGLVIILGSVLMINLVKNRKGRANAKNENESYHENESAADAKKYSKVILKTVE
ncbi:MAG: EamA family transporter [Ferruginibacter sp.]